MLIAAHGPFPGSSCFPWSPFLHAGLETALGLKHYKATWEPLGGDWLVEAVPGSWAFWRVCLLSFSLPFTSQHGGLVSRCFLFRSPHHLAPFSP